MKSQFFFNFPNQRLRGFLTFLDVTAEKVPMIWKRYLRLIVAQVNQQSPTTIEEENLGDLLHGGNFVTSPAR